ncbi:RNA-dependent RNA polymerase [Phytophthora cinnamomi ormycovirus 2-25]|uniref:RNA-dependent RNA polymerase n=1 Tax=Phytophthora cinnamomi ormycovirus 2-25 TaxID=3239321 RepID=A0AB39JBQ3_9VIRU
MTSSMKQSTCHKRKISRLMSPINRSTLVTSKGRVSYNAHPESAVPVFDRSHANYNLFDINKSSRPISDVHDIYISDTDSLRRDKRAVELLRENALQSGFSNYAPVSFHDRPVEWDDCVFNVIDDVRNLRYSDDPDEFFVLALLLRQKYVSSGKDIFLRTAESSMYISEFGRTCKDRRSPHVKLGAYLYHSVNSGPAFATFLKKLRNVNTIDSFKKEEKSITLEYKEYRSKVIDRAKEYFGSDFELSSRRSYDNFLNESYLVFFKEDTDDTEWAFSYKPSDEYFVERFRRAIRSILPDVDVVEPTAEDMSFWVSSSKTATGPDEKKVNRTIHRENPQTRGSLTKDFRFTRTKINVSPANCRDSWVSDLDTLFTIKYISHLLRPVLSGIKFSAMHSSKIALQRRLKEFRSSLETYMMLDFKKAGLTIPYILIRVMKEELIQKYGVDAFEYIDGYENAIVFDKGVPRKPLRGTGLGNANELATLLQCGIAAIMEENRGWDALTYNDDGIWKTRASLYRKDFAALTGLCERLGIEVNYKKSYLSSFNVFCEDYFEEDTLWDKRQLFFLTGTAMYFQNSIANAKRYHHNYMLSLIGTPYIVSYERQMYEFYGVEYHRFENLLPSSIGGWNFIEDSNFNSIFKFMMEGCKPGWTIEQKNSYDTCKRFFNCLMKNRKSLDYFLTCKLTYKKEVRDSMLQHNICPNIFEDTENELCTYYKVTSTDDLIQAEYDVMNTYSSKSLSSKIGQALTKKSALQRRRFLKIFVRNKNYYDNKVYLHSLEKSVESLESLGMKRFAIPNVLYRTVECSEFRQTSRRCQTSQATTKYKVPESIAGVRSQIVASLSSREADKLLPGLDVYCLTNSWLNRKIDVVRSKNRICIPRAENVGWAPDYLQIFSSNKRSVYIDTITREGSEVEFIVKDGDYYPSSFSRANSIKFVPASVSWIPVSITYKILRSWSLYQKRIFQRIVYNHGICNLRLLRSIEDRIDKLEETIDLPQEEDLTLDLEFPNDEDHLHGDLDVDDLLALVSEEGGMSSPRSWHFSDDNFSDYGSEPDSEAFGYEDLEFESRDVRRTGDVFDDEDY